MPNYFFHSQVDAKCSTTLFYLLLLFSWEVLSNSFGIPWTTCDKTGYCVEAKNLCEFIKILVLSVTTCVNLKNSGSFYICETEAVILRYLFLMGFELSSVVLRFFFVVISHLVWMNTYIAYINYIEMSGYMNSLYLYYHHLKILFLKCSPLMYNYVFFQ